MSDPKLEFDAKKAVYDQDNNFYRYRDGLMWTRLQTISAFEGGTIYAVSVVNQITKAEKLLFLFAVTLVIAAVYRLMMKDMADCASHLRRMASFEKDVVSFERPKFRGPKGYALVHMIVSFVIFVNTLLFFWKALYA